MTYTSLLLVVVLLAAQPEDHQEEALAEAVVEVHQALAEAVADDCRLADAVLATVPIRQDCGSPAKTAYDFFDLWRYGALSASVTDEGSIVVRTVNGVRGDRPWVWRPTPRRDQYWRQQQ